MKYALSLLACTLLAACSGSGPVTSAALAAAGGAGSSANARLTVPPGFAIDVVAHVAGAHGLAFLPGGDLLVGTGGSTVSLVPQADATAGTPQTFASLPDSPAYGVAVSGANVYVSTQSALWQIPYSAGDRSASAQKKIARYRTGPIAPNSDGDVHRSASVAVTGGHVYIGIGSSCNACVEVDPTRATIARTNLDGSAMTTAAAHIRNALALAVDPATGILWAGGRDKMRYPPGIRTSFSIASHRIRESRITAGRHARRIGTRIHLARIVRHRRATHRVAGVFHADGSGVLSGGAERPLRVPRALSRRPLHQRARQLASHRRTFRSAACRIRADDGRRTAHGRRLERSDAAMDGVLKRLPKCFRRAYRPFERHRRRTERKFIRQRRSDGRYLSHPSGRESLLARSQLVAVIISHLAFM